MKLNTPLETNVLENADLLGYRLSTLVKDASTAIANRTEQFGTPDADSHRWNAIAKTHFQEGLAALRRAIEVPERF